MMSIGGGNKAIVTSQNQVFIFPSEHGALKSKGIANLGLYVISHLKSINTSGGGDTREEVKGVDGRRVHEEEERVQALKSSSSGTMEHADVAINSDWTYLVAHLGEKWAEPQQIRLSTCGPFGAHSQVTFLQ